MPSKLNAKHRCDCSSWISDHEDYGKSWDQVFLQKNRKQHDRTFQQCLQQEDVERDPIDAFLQYTDNSIPSRGVQQAKIVLNKIANSKAKLLNPRRAWVDYRTKASGQKSSPRWLTPSELKKFIKDRVSYALVIFEDVKSDTNYPAVYKCPLQYRRGPSFDVSCV